MLFDHMDMASESFTHVYAMMTGAQEVVRGAPEESLSKAEPQLKALRQGIEAQAAVASAAAGKGSCNTVAARSISGS